jgi:hypothetical protein
MEDVQVLLLADKPPEVNRKVVYHARQHGRKVEAPELVWSDAPIFSDGSCKDVSDKLIARASAALVQPNPDGTLTCLASAVPGNLPQSAVMAEHWALALLVATVKPEQQVVLYSDCQAVVNGRPRCIPTSPSLEAFGKRPRTTLRHVSKCRLTSPRTRL